jgi:hypothetical protein
MEVIPQIRPSKKFYDMINYCRASAIMDGKKVAIADITDCIADLTTKEKLWQKVKNEKLI